MLFICNKCLYNNLFEKGDETKQKLEKRHEMKKLTRTIQDVQRKPVTESI